MTDSSENLINNNTYTPYGTRTKHNSSYATSNSLTSVDTNYTFSGREDDGNGLMYYRNRYYSPTMKRFISEDPIGLGGGINQYAYVGGNPLMYYDPNGENPVLIIAGIGIIATGIVFAITPGDVEEHLNGGFDFLLGYGIASLAILAPEGGVALEIGTAVFGTSVDAALYARTVAGMLHPPINDPKNLAPLEKLQCPK